LRVVEIDGLDRDRSTSANGLGYHLSKPGASHAELARRAADQLTS
jgi:hypothetical protein